MKQNMALRTITGLLLLIGTTGCGTVLGHTMLPSDRSLVNSRVYRGTQFDVGLLSSVAKNQEPVASAYGMLFGLVWVCDLPLSVAADTLILPFDACSSHDEVMGSTPDSQL